ncbi:MAG: hypothetical protein LBP82_01985, partial [Candidatus Methanoplasma sp.]|nr:hypothetical protein [Candidatus Methanoplasma sp.]
MSFFDRFRKNKAVKPIQSVAKEVKKAVKPAAPAKVVYTKTPESIAAAQLKPADLGELLPGAPPGGKINLAVYWA